MPYRTARTRNTNARRSDTKCTAQATKKMSATMPSANSSSRCIVDLEASAAPLGPDMDDDREGDQAVLGKPRRPH
eukprot:6832040-Prorocentrum_lima.AAC.1